MIHIGYSNIMKSEAQDTSGQEVDGKGAKDFGGRDLRVKKVEQRVGVSRVKLVYKISRIYGQYTLEIGTE